MNGFDDLLPEERVPEHEELISLLGHAYQAPIFLSSTEKDQVIERVRERLLQIGLEDNPQEGVSESQNGVLHSYPRIAVLRARKPQRNRRRFRFIALFAAALVVAVLLVTPLLLLRHSLTGGAGGFPTLTLSSNPAKVGESVWFTLSDATPSTRVVLTHDFQEPIQVNGSPSIITDSKGTARFRLIIAKDWESGFHRVVAEDVATRNTASAYLQIIGQGSAPLLPPNLLINSSSIHMGAGVVGANTIRTFNLVNSGGGSITWSASSDKPWLLVSPSQGIFSQQETISLAVQRAGLVAGVYTGNITISTNVSPPQRIEVDMTVRSLPLNAAPVLALPTALLSFSATDGQSTSPQTLTISNPGSNPLHWSLAVNTLVTPVTQFSLTQTQEFTCNWLSATPNVGTLFPGETRFLKVNVNSQCLLPGAYVGTLKFNAAGAIESSQAVNVSLTVQPNCGLVTSTGYLAFTVVHGQDKVSNQTLSLNTTPGCIGTPIQWNSSSNSPWLTTSPENSQLRGAANTFVQIEVNAKSLKSGTQSGNIFFVTGHSTLTVTVEVNVQAAPPLVSPIMGASPLSLNFSNIQGHSNPTGQVVTITNNGPSVLNWRVSPQALASSWLGASPADGTIAAGQSGRVTINVNTAQLTPGNYAGQITLNGMDARGKTAPGSPQIIAVNLVVQPPCTISPPSSSVLSFSAVQGASATPVEQAVMFTAWGDCQWPLAWKTSVTSRANWLKLTSSGASVKSTGQSGTIAVNTSIAGLVAGTYKTTVTIAASDASGAAVQGSTQTFTVTLTILPPCVLSPPSPATMTYSLAQGQATSTALNVALSETGACADPVTWQASTADAWLMLTATSGTDSGTGSTFGVNITAANLSPGTYTGSITITAIDSNGVAVGSAQSVAVTLTVTGYTISGTVLACADQTCATQELLAGATVTLINGSTTVATTTADASGAYSFSNIPLGSYTVTVAGTDASNTSYVGSLSLTLTGNASNTTIQALPG